MGPRNATVRFIRPPAWHVIALCVKYTRSRDWNAARFDHYAICRTAAVRLERTFDLEAELDLAVQVPPFAELLNPSFSTRLDREEQLRLGAECGRN